jgi:hypothetical protein
VATDRGMFSGRRALARAPLARAPLTWALLAPLALAACSGGGHPAPAAAHHPAAAGAGHHPAAAAPAGAAPAPAAPAPAALPASAPAGWPMAHAAYLGRYRLTASSDGTFAKSGLLTLFMREIKKPKEMVVPSGVLSAFSPGQTTVLYLSGFQHSGSRAMAEVSAGNYGYPPSGQAWVTRFSQAGHVLQLSFAPTGGHPVTLTFTRYAADPHP